MERKLSYSNFNATMAMAKASFRSIIRSPSAVVFSLAFPLIFILVFGSLGGGGVTVNVGVEKNADTINPVYRALSQVKAIHLVTDKTAEEMKLDLSKGRIDVIMGFSENAQGLPKYLVNVQYTTASVEKGNIFRSILGGILSTINSKVIAAAPQVVGVHETTVKARIYRYIDFILPGQLGFSLLSSGVFGTAFVFLSLRVTLVIKRFFATPVSKASIVIGEAIARIVFALIGALFIILVGHFFFHFTLINGVTTVLNMLVLSTIGLIVFMGFGFTVSGLAKNESSIPPIANLITMPQFLLSGTFFSIEAFPSWLQPISRVLPLTYLNDAMRKVAFEGAGLGDVTHQLLILLLWGIGIYGLAVKVFKWEA